MSLRGEEKERGCLGRKATVQSPGGLRLGDGTPYSGPWRVVEDDQP